MRNVSLAFFLQEATSEGRADDRAVRLGARQLRRRPQAPEGSG